VSRETVDRDDLWYRPDEPPTVYESGRIETRKRPMHQRFTRPSDGATTYRISCRGECGHGGDGIPTLSAYEIREDRPFYRVEVSRQCPKCHGFEAVEWETVQELADPDQYADDRGQQPKLTEVIG